MKRIYIYCEGQTEESFINNILQPYFFNVGIYVIPIICTTKRTKQGKFKGGVITYSKIKRELQKLCGEHRNELVTTMFDYYAMPEDTPNISCDESDIHKRIELIEDAINKDLGIPNCRFNFMLHEFEGLLFSYPEAFAAIADDTVVEEIQNIRDTAETPEHINNSPETAPSKRLLKLMPQYSKVRNGILVAQKIGIDKLLEQCPHFRQWIEEIKAF